MKTVLGAILAAWSLAACDAGFLTPSRSGFAVEPESLNFGPTALSLPSELKLVLRNEGRAPFWVNAARIEGSHVSVEPFEPFQLSSGGQRALAVVFSPDDEAAVDGVVMLETDTTSAGNDGIARVPFEGRGVKAYTLLSPKRLDFGNLELGKARSLELEASNPTGAAAPLHFVIEGPDAALFSSAEAGQDLVLAPGETRMLPIVFHADRLLAAQATLRPLACGACPDQPVALDGFGINSVVEISPSRIEFGRVPVGARAEAKVLITNQGTQALEFGGFEWRDPPGPFSFEPMFSTLIEPGRSIEGTVSFAPLANVPVPVTFLQVKVRADNTVAGSWPMLPVKGEVGDSCVVVLPRSVDFGIVPEGMTATRSVDLLNRCGRDIVITDTPVSIITGGFFGLGQAPKPLPVASGGKVSVALVFNPKQGSGLSTAKLGFKVQQGAAISYGEVPLKGQTTSFPPCAYSVVPSAVDFGLVEVGTDVTLGAALSNVGADACFLSGAQLMAGSDPDFSSAGLSSRLLAPGESALLLVRFKPHSVGSFSALGEAFLNGPGGHATISFVGQGVSGCLQLAPSSLSFGTTKLGCPARSKTMTASNTCAAPVTISSAVIGLATGTGFSVVPAPVLPLTLSPGSKATLGVTYQPASDGEAAAGLLVEAGLGRPLTVGLTGRAVSGLNQTDRFFQDGQGKVDLLFVVDNSGSMTEEQTGLAQNFAAVLSAAQSSGIDYHIGVTTTGIDTAPGGWAVCPGGAEGGEAGRLFPADGSTPRVITPSTPNAAAVFAANVQVGWCHWDEQGLEAAYRALSPPLVSSADDPRTAMPNDGNAGFLRQDAKLAIIALSDEDDASPQAVGFYSAFFKALKGGDSTLLSFSAVVGPGDLSNCPTAASSGTRYMQLAQETGGIAESICTQDWATSLQKLSANAFGPRSRFPLSERPLDPTAVSVQVNGVPVTAGWTYESSTNSVVFAPSAAPPAGSVIDVTYPLGC